MTLDLDNLARLVAASEKVNPTPWTVLADGGPPDDLRFAAYIDDDDENCVVQPGVRLASAKLIAGAVNALPALLADHARLTAEVADLRDDIAAGEQGRDYLRTLIEEAQRGQRKAEAEVARLRGLVERAEAMAAVVEASRTVLYASNQPRPFVEASLNRLAAAVETLDAEARRG